MFESIKNKHGIEIDEIMEYRQCRYICDKDGCWRIYGFDIHSKMPSVERLHVHLLNKHMVRFNVKANLKSVADDEWLQRTMLTEWFVANRCHANARSLTYCDFPTKWTWLASKKQWIPKTSSYRIGRIYSVHPTTGELFYLRMLLMVVKGAMSYTDVRTYNGIVYETFKEACAARGLLGDDLEWYSAFDEALTWGMGDQLRRLFVTILVHCGVNDENAFFEKYWSHLAEDIKYNIKRSFRDDNHVVPPDELRDILLDKLTVLFSKNGSNILDHKLPLKTTYDDNSDDNDMITDELSADPKSELLKAETMYNQLNPDQLLAYKNIIDRVVSGKPGFFFVSGYGGTGKTFLWSSIIAYLRGKERIVLTVASSGVAALLLPGGRTAHSRFKIPISLDDNGTCDIKRSSKLAEMIESASLIIWDEALMTHRRCFEALDRSLRDILSADDPSIADMPFGGKVMVLGGDLRQILPVIEGGTRSQVINAAITNSPLWSFIEVLHLNVNMRLAVQTTDPVLQAEIASFAGWMLSIGDGTAPCVTRQGECEPSWVTIPDDMLIHSEDNRIGAIVNVVYPNFAKNCSNRKYLCQRAILTTTNDLAQEVNDHVLALMPSAEREYLSYDSIGNAADSMRNMDVFYPIEYLNTIKINNFPQHKLLLKKGVPIMLLRNLSQATGLCNGTRLVVSKLGEKVIEAIIMTGSNIGDVVYIPRICLTAKDPKWPFTLHRRQFPVRVCYAMTINKSQGQTLSAVGLYLKSPVFTHGQLYVAVSRVTSKKNLKILIENEDGTLGSQTRNIVFSEIFESLE